MSKQQLEGGTEFFKAQNHQYFTSPTKHATALRPYHISSRVLLVRHAKVDRRRAGGRGAIRCLARRQVRRRRGARKVERHRRIHGAKRKDKVGNQRRNRRRARRGQRVGLRSDFVRDRGSGLGSGTPLTLGSRESRGTFRE